MITLTPQFILFLETLLFSSVILMNLARKNFQVVYLYAAQSLIITFVLFNSALRDMSFLLLAVVMLTFLVKVIVAPYFFSGLLKKHQLHFTASNYFNIPMTLVGLTAITIFSFSHFLRPLIILAPKNENALLLAMAMMFASIFLTMNRKGVLSQMVGILSLENAIVSFAFLSGLESSVGPQVGILFDILVWIIIASIFASMIYRHFGSFDVSTMKSLKEE